jgi:hypothetical protein
MVILSLELGSQGSTFCTRSPNLCLPVVRAALAEHGECCDAGTGALHVAVVDNDVTKRLTRVQDLGNSVVSISSIPFFPYR